MKTLLSELFAMLELIVQSINERMPFSTIAARALLESVHLVKI